MKKIIIAVIAIASIAGMAIYAQKNEKVTIWKRRVRLTPSGTRDLTPRAK